MELIIREKDKEIAYLLSQLNKSEESFESYKARIKVILSSQLVAIENYKRFEKKQFINSEKARIGEYVPFREGSKFRDIWVDGHELRNFRTELANIVSKREALEALRKKLKKKPAKPPVDEKSIKPSDFGFDLVSSYTGNLAAALLAINPPYKDNNDQKNKNNMNYISGLYGGIECSENSN